MGFVTGVVAAFPVGLLFGRFVLGYGWGRATAPGFDAALLAVLSPAVAAIARAAYGALLHHAERHD